MTTAAIAPADARSDPVSVVRPRLDSIDLLRGAVMVLMVLDHTRDFFMDVRVNPTDLSRTTPALFFTRWVTHFCAPVFVFLAGTGAYLASTRKTRPELSRFLLVRGLWLLVLELTVVRFGLTFGLVPTFLPLTVLWAIGAAMIALAALVFLPARVVGLFGVALIVGHNAFDVVRPESLGGFGLLWRILHVQGPIGTVGGAPIFVLYPLVPWIGVMAAGFGFGELIRLEPARRRRWLLGLGLGLTAAFVLLRASNLYGDPNPWSVQKSPLFTLMSFLNCQKYPPSLLYLLMTLGPAIAALAVFDRGVGPIGRPLVTFGRVPLFYYLLQWFVIHTLAIAVNAALGRPYAWLIGNGPFESPPGYGFGLPTTYLMWAVVVLLLYPPCHWFAELKRRRRDAWLSYL